MTAASAEDGLALLEQHNRAGSPDPFGLVILDWLLPGMNGLDAAERIRAHPETRSLPIIMISAYAGKEEEARCAAARRQCVPAQANHRLLSVRRHRRIAWPSRPYRTPSPRCVQLQREFDGVRALLAEDNEANQMVATELLGRLGIDLDVAGDGREAVAMAQAAPGKYRRS